MPKDISAEAIVASNQLQELVAAYQKPRMPTGPTGIPHVDNGPTCTARTGAECFLSSDQREALIAEFNVRLSRAEIRYVAAIERLRLDGLLAKDENVDWLATLILDVAGSFLVARLASTLKGLRVAAEAELEAMAATARLSGMSKGWTKSVQRLAGAVSEKNVESGIKSAIGVAKKVAGGALSSRSGSSDAVSARGFMVRQLSAQSGSAFQAVSSTIRATATDVEMLAVVQSLDAALHTTDAYEDMLKEKLARFASSGIPEIGRKEAIRMHPLGDGKDAPRVPQETLRDTAVVWVEYAAGRPRELFYEVHDGIRVADILHPGGAHYPRAAPPEFGPAKPVTPSSEIGAPVPLEFIDVAVARHTQVWGTPPRTIVEKPHWAYLREAFEQGRNDPGANGPPAPEPADWTFPAVVDRELKNIGADNRSPTSGTLQDTRTP